jgi:hypothetical protein
VFPQTVFDLSRQRLLAFELPPMNIGPRPAEGHTTSPFGVRPNEIGEWRTFENEALQYWKTIPQADKTALVYAFTSATTDFNIFRDIIVANEEGVKLALATLPFRFHRQATRSHDGQPLPSDDHSDIVPFQQGWGFEGSPDYFFFSSRQRRITAVLDAKKPWSVTPQQISDVLDGILLCILC